MINEKYEILWKVHEYKNQLRVLNEARSILRNMDNKTYHQPYRLIMKELDNLIYNFYKEYDEVYKKFIKIKENITIDDIITMEY